MIEINLIPDVKRELIKAQRARAAVTSVAIIVSLIAIGVVALLAIYVFVVQNTRSVVLDNDIKNGAAELSSVEDLSKVLTIQNQLKGINTYNQQKNIDSRLFDILLAVTPPDPDKVTFSSVAINGTTQSIRLEGQTANFSSVEIFKKTVDNAIVTHKQDGETAEDKLASNISVSDVSYGEDSEGNKVVRFVLEFTYWQDYLSTSIDTPVLKLKVNGNVTDSYLGIPRSLFTERAKDLEEGS